MSRKSLYATEHGSFVRHQPTGTFGSWDLLSQQTREYEVRESCLSGRGDWGTTVRGLVSLAEREPGFATDPYAVY